MKKMDTSLFFFLGIIILAAASGLGSSAIVPGAAAISILFFCLYKVSRDIFEKRKVSFGWIISSAALLIFLLGLNPGRDMLSAMVEPFVIRSLERRLRSQPDETVTLQHLSTIHTTRRNEAKALPYIEQLLQRNPCDALALSNRALLSRFGRRYDESLRDCKKAAACDSASAQRWDQLGFAYIGVNALDSARGAFQIALRLSTNKTEQERIRKHVRILEKPR